MTKPANCVKLNSVVIKLLALILTWFLFLGCSTLIKITKPVELKKNQVILFYKKDNKIVIKQCEDNSILEKGAQPVSCKIKQGTKVKNVPILDFKESLKMALRLPTGGYDYFAKEKIEFRNMGEKSVLLNEILYRKRELKEDIARIKFFIEKFANKNFDSKHLSILKNTFLQFEEKINGHAQLDQIIYEINSNVNALIYNILSERGYFFNYVSSNGNTGFIFNVLEAFVKTPMLRISLQRIDKGSFLMGSLPDESRRYNTNAGQKQVTISKSFDIMTTEMTQMQWFSCMGNNPSQFKRPEDCENHLSIRGTNLCPDNPVENVSWKDVQQCIRRLNSSLGLVGCNGTPKSPQGCYRLPTEAEWEFSARGKTTTAYSFGDSSSNLENYAWYWSNSNNKTHPVGLKKPNSHGLFDMHGNVWEWVQDKANKLLIGGRDPLVTSSKLPGYIIKGGCWFGYAWVLRSEKRYSPKGGADSRIGFRLVTTI